MNLEQIETRLSEIRNLLDGPADNIDIDALTKESNDLISRRSALRERATRLQELRNRVAAGAGSVIREHVADDAPQEEARGADSPEYRRAFLLNLANRSGDMTKEERAAFTHTTANTTAPLPTTMLNQIWDLVSKEHAIMGDVTIYRTGTVLEVVKHTAIAAGAAKSVAEGAANDDEKNTFVKVSLSGKDFSKSVEISYAMERMSIDALETYLVNEIAAGLGDAMAADVIASIIAGIAAGNQIPSAATGTLSFKDVAKAFGQLARVRNVTVYATRSTIYNYLVGMTDTSGKPIFQPNAQLGAEGVILGAAIKVEDAVADGTLLIGDAKKVVYNMVQDIMVERDKDIKTHKVIHSGYARGEGALIDDKAFCALTVKSGA